MQAPRNKDAWETWDIYMRSRRVVATGYTALQTAFATSLAVNERQQTGHESRRCKTSSLKGQAGGLATKKR